MQQMQSVVYALLQNRAYVQELRLLVLDNAAVWRYAHLAVGKCVERVERLVRRYARSQVNKNLGLGSRDVLNLADLYLALLDGFQYALDERSGRLAERNLAYYQRLVVEFLDFCAHLYRAASLAVVVLAYVNASSRKEIGIEVEFLAVKVGDGSVANLVKVVRKYF